MSDLETSTTNEPYVGIGSIVGVEQTDELGFCSWCRAIVKIHVTTWSSGHRGSFVDYHLHNEERCNGGRPAILTFGPELGWISFTVAG